MEFHQKSTQKFILLKISQPTSCDPGSGTHGKLNTFSELLYTLEHTFILYAQDLMILPTTKINMQGLFLNIQNILHVGSIITDFMSSVIFSVVYIKQGLAL